jgi:DNA helicase-2/ATP-dependent DNA helicase PcrA
MGPVTARKALDFIASRDGSLAALNDFEVPPALKLDLARFARLMTSIADPQRPWAGQVRMVRDWYQPQMERIYEHTHTRIGDLDQLDQLSTGFPSRERFLSELTLDPPQAAGDLAGTPHKDEDYLVLSTVHSAKGMEWDTVFVLNVVDGSFPSEFSTGKPELIDEERRLLYVAMTRARDELQLCVPLKFMLTQQPKNGDAHVYGGRSRFITEKVLAAVDQSAFHGSREAEVGLANEKTATLDVANAIKDMW